MNYLIFGLLLFLGVHSVRIVADDWRTRTLAGVGPSTYKGIYAAVSLLGFGLMVWGFGLARETPVVLWNPPVYMRHLASLLTLVAFILLAAAYVPRNGIKARLHHPMVLGVRGWAVAHLLATGTLAHAVLFGSVLVWAVLDYFAAKRRDRVQAIVYPAGTAAGSVLTIGVGIGAWAVFAFQLHGLLIGVRPFG